MTRVLISVLLGIIFCGMPCVARAQEEGPAMKKGAEACQKEDYAGAIADFTEAIRLNPGNADAYRLRGICWSYKGELDKSIADFDRSIEIDPLYERTFLYRGTVYMQKKDYPMALYNFSSAIDLDAKDVKAFVARGLTYYALNENDKAIDDFDQAIKLVPGNAEAYNGRGAAYAAKQLNVQAIQDCNRAIELNPKLAKAYDNRGRAYAGIRDFAKATADYEQALHLDAKLGSAYNDFAWLLATCPQDDIRNGKKAVEYANKACELSQWKDSATTDTLAAAYAEVGDFDNAVNWERKYLATPSLNPKAAAGANLRLGLYHDHKPFRSEK